MVVVVERIGGPVARLEYYFCGISQSLVKTIPLESLLA